MEFEQSNASLMNTTTDFGSRSRGNVSFNVSTFFTEDSDKFAQVFHDIFIDFHSICVDGGTFAEVVDRFRETASNGVLIFEKFSEGGIRGGKRVANIKASLQKERNAYDLILKLHQTEAVLEESEDESSLLRKLLKHNIHFRKLITLLHWSEEVAFADPLGFSQLLVEIEEASKGHSFIDSVRKGNFAHADSCFLDVLSDSDLEGLDRIKRVFFCLLRCGRFKKLNELLDITALPMLKTFVEAREVLTNPDESPLSPKAENYDYLEARLFLKQTVNLILSNPSDSVTPIDQCIWATVGGNLPVLLAHSQIPEDILWSYVNCAVENILDETVVDARSVEDPDILEALESKVDKILKIDDVFRDLMNHINDPYYRLIGYLSSGLLETVIDFMYDECVGKEVDPNTLRLYAHVVLLIKNGTYAHNPVNADAVITEYTHLLSTLTLYSSVPHYLSKLNDPAADREMVNFLYCLEGNQPRLEALQAAVETERFDVGKLCIEVYNKAKAGNPFLDGEATPESVAKLMDVWKFLLVYPEKTSIEALLECNNVLRGLFVRDRLGEAMELLAISEHNLVVLSERHLKQVMFSDKRGQDKLIKFVQDQQREFNSYILYLEIMDKFTVWQGKVKMQLPRQPEKLPDADYARLDLSTKAEYERKLNAAQEKLMAHRSSLDKYQKSVVDQIHYLLSQTSTWMVCCLNEDEMDDFEEQERRRKQMLKVHERYLYYCLTMLITIYQDSRQEREALNIANLLMDGRFDLFAQLSKESLRKIFEQISKSGHVISVNVG